MKLKITAGPWVAHKYKKQDVKRAGYILIQDRNHNAKNIATCIPDIRMNDDECEANAKLISAAPELLEALIFCQSVIISNGIYDLSEKMANEKAINAISKATK